MKPFACWDSRFESRWFVDATSCACCVLSCRGLCDEPITQPDEYYQMWCVWV